MLVSHYAHEAATFTPLLGQLDADERHRVLAALLELGEARRPG